MSNLQPTPIIDVNGVVTTRNKRLADSTASSKRIQGVSAPSLSTQPVSPLTEALTKSLTELRSVGVYSILLDAHEGAHPDGTLEKYPSINEIYSKTGKAMTVQKRYIPDVPDRIITGYRTIVNESLLKINNTDALIELAELPGTDSNWVDETHFRIDISKLN